MPMRSTPATPARSTTRKMHTRAADHGHGAPHESPWVMVVPLMILALLSFVGGWMGVPHSLHGADHFDAFLSPVFHADGDGC